MGAREEREALQARQKAYHLAFSPIAGQEVLKDLMKFCRGGPGEVPWDKDPRISDVLMGRYEVFQRIMQHMGLSPDRLCVLYSGGNLRMEDLRPPEETEA